MRNGDTYQLFTSAWAARDVDALLALVTDDIVYGASIGPEPGETFVGQAAVREGFARMLAHDDASEIEVKRLDMIEDRAYAQWRFVLADGSEVHGVDVLEFRDSKIAVKQGYRKSRA
jgi:ketosteroid isomerase-like protein